MTRQLHHALKGASRAVDAPSLGGQRVGVRVALFRIFGGAKIVVVPEAERGVFQTDLGADAQNALPNATSMVNAQRFLLGPADDD